MYNTSRTSVGGHWRIIQFLCCRPHQWRKLQNYGAYKILRSERGTCIVQNNRLRPGGKGGGWRSGHACKQNETITKLQSVQKITPRASDVHCAELQAMVGWKRQRKKKWTMDIRESQTKYAHNRAEQVLQIDGEIGEKKIEGNMWQWYWPPDLLRNLSFNHFLSNKNVALCNGDRWTVHTHHNSQLLG